MLLTQSLNTLAAHDLSRGLLMKYEMINRFNGFVNKYLKLDKQALFYSKPFRKDTLVSFDPNKINTRFIITCI